MVVGTDVKTTIQVARNGGKYDDDDYEFAEEPDGDGIYQWQWKAQTIHMLNVKVQKLMDVVWNLMLNKSKDSDAWDVIQLTEQVRKDQRLPSRGNRSFRRCLSTRGDLTSTWYCSLVVLGS